MPKKTDLEIQAEWKELRLLKKQVPTKDPYKVNMQKLVAAQVKTLYERLTLPHVKALWPDGDINGAAEDAIYWATGGDIPSPSSLWKSYLATLKKPAENRGVTIGI